MNLQNSTKGIVSSEKENSKKTETTQAKNPESPQQTNPGFNSFLDISTSSAIV